jgi:hypothetical protein
MEDQAWFWVDKPDETVGMEPGEYDELRGKVPVKVDQRLGFEGKHIVRRECKWEIEKDGMGPCTSEIVHPIINPVSEYSMRGSLTSWLFQYRYLASRSDDYRICR